MGDSDFSVKEIVTEIKETLKDHVKQTDKRLDALEQWRSWIIGGMAILTFIMPFVLYKIL